MLLTNYVLYNLRSGAKNKNQPPAPEDDGRTKAARATARLATPSPNQADRQKDPAARQKPKSSEPKARSVPLTSF